MSISHRDPLTSSLDAANLSSAMQTAAAAAEQFAARVAQTLGMSPAALPNQPNATVPPLPQAGATGFAQLFANLLGNRGGGQPFGQLQQTLGQLAKSVQQAVQATNKGRDAAKLQVGELQQGADNMFAALARGNNNVADFAAFLGRANNAVQGFADNLAKLGQMRPVGWAPPTGNSLVGNAHPTFAGGMQVAQQMQQFLSLLPKQIGQSLQGGQQIQQLVDAANASGNPQQAIDIARSYVTAQLNQSYINAQNLANSVDPIMHSFGAPGQLAPQGNLQFLLTQPGQLQDTIRMFQSMLANLDQMSSRIRENSGAGPPDFSRSQLRPMADGGVVTDPTMALIGEAGPEAVIPLARLQAMFGNPANMFARNRNGTLAPQWLTAGGLANFDAAFNRASQVLGRQLDLGDSGAGAILDRWNQMQDTAIGAVDWMNQRRRIDLGSGSGLPGQQKASSHAAQSLSSALHFNFGDIHVAGQMTQQEIGTLFDRIENEARSRGYDMTGRAALRRPPQSTRGPLTPAGYAR